MERVTESNQHHAFLTYTEVWWTVFRLSIAGSELHLWLELKAAINRRASSIVWVLPALETKNPKLHSEAKFCIKEKLMRVESKSRIERIMTKEWEILMKMGEGSRGGTQKAQGSAFVSSKATEEGTLKLWNYKSYQLIPAS